MRGLLEQLEITSYIFYVHDIGGPVAFRLFEEAPEQVRGSIIQNANTYEEGVAEDAREALGPFWANRNEDTEKLAKRFMARGYIEHLWKVGARDEGRADPDRWLVDQTLMSGSLMARPGDVAGGYGPGNCEGRDADRPLEAFERRASPRGPTHGRRPQPMAGR